MWKWYLSREQTATAWETGHGDIPPEPSLFAHTICGTRGSFWHLRATSWENLFYDICEQQRCRSAYASAQSDQHLYCLLPRQFNTYTCYIQNFKTLASLCSWAGWFASNLVGHPRRHVFSWHGSSNSWRSGHTGWLRICWTMLRSRFFSFLGKSSQEKKHLSLITSQAKSFFHF